jgi:copper chaperone
MLIPYRGIDDAKFAARQQGSDAMTEITYTVPGMSCSHCEQAVSSELLNVEGVEAVEVDLGSKLVHVCGSALDDARLRGAIEAAGYEAA